MGFSRNKKVVFEYLNKIYRNKRMDVNELYDYVWKDLGISLVDFYYMIFLGKEYIKKEQITELEGVFGKLIDYRFEKKVSNINYCERNSGLINRLYEFSKMGELSGSELLGYLKENFNYAPVNLKTRIEMLMKYDVFDYQVIVNLMEIYVKIQECVRYNGVGQSHIKQPSEQKIKESSDVIAEFIESGFSYKKFFAQKHLKYDDITMHLSLVERKNPELYNLYLDYIKLREDYVRREILPKVPELVSKIKNGIVMTDGRKREFDVLDFYLLIGDTFLDDFIDLFKKSNPDPDDNRVISRFYSGECIDRFGRYAIKPRKLNALFNSYIEMYGNVVDDNIKIEILTYLYQNQIPVTIKTFKVAVKRYFENSLCSDENKFINVLN